jgi:hypothetical protein
MHELGFTLKFSEPEKPWAGWMQPGVDRPLFLIGRPYNGDRVMVYLRSKSGSLAMFEAAARRAKSSPRSPPAHTSPV